MYRLPFYTISPVMVDTVENINFKYLLQTSNLDTRIESGWSIEVCQKLEGSYKAARPYVAIGLHPVTYGRRL